MNHRTTSQAPSLRRRRRMSAALASFLAMASLLAIGVANAVAAPPTAIAEAPVFTQVSGTSYKVELKGTVNPNALATTYYFEWGATTAYGAKNGVEMNAGSGSSPVSVSTGPIPGFTEGLSYHFRVVAKNKDGTTFGADYEFVPKTIPSWSLQTTPSLSQSELKDVSCLPGGECFAVGFSGGEPFSATTLTVAQRWNGTEWKTQSTPVLGGTGHSLEGISCTSTTTCTAVGYKTVAGLIKPLAERWDGTSWKTQEVPGAGALQAVSCASATECVAIGAGGGSARWNGKEWSSLSGPIGELIRDVSCTSASFCMAVSHNATTYTWNGSLWKSQKTPAGSMFLGVSCTASNACTAVGRTMEGLIMSPLAARWNGSEWSVQETPSPGAISTSLAGVSCPSSTICYATGRTGTSTFAERWNGTSWAIQSTPNPAGSTSNILLGVSCSTVTICESVGSTQSPGKVVTLAERAS